MELPNEEISISASDPHQLLNELMAAYGNELKRIAFLYVNDESECEDIIQEVFVSCFRNIHNFQHSSSYKTWLTRITINKCKDHLKKWSFRNLLYRPFVSVQKTDPSAEVSAMSEMAAEEMAGYLSHLSPKYKDVLILFYYQELTMNEISDVLDVGSNTVKSRLLRGKKALQVELERSGFDGSL